MRSDAEDSRVGTDSGQTAREATVNGQRVSLRVSDGRLRVDDATVVSADVRASNGIIHVIDQVLLPEESNLVALARSAGTFDTLLAAARAAGPAETLATGGPFTLFAPTDEAFAALPEGTLERLLAEPELATLQRILTYHVVEGRLFSDDALAAGRTSTVAGEAVAVRVTEGRLRVNESAIVSADLDAANGVVHVIDRVLLPPRVTAGAAGDAGSDDRSSLAAADRLIRLAIQRGAPLFNDGDAGACAAVYEVAATSLVEGGYALPAPARRALESALRRAARSSDDRARAWALCGALDAAVVALAERMTPATH